MLNVLTVIQDGGMETLVSRIYSGLDRNKYELHVCSLTGQPGEHLMNSFKNSETIVHSVNIVNKDIGISNILKNFIEFIKLCLYFRANKFHVINAHDFFSAAVSRFAIISNFILFYKPDKVYITLHNIFFWLRPVHHKINKILSVVTNKIICVSESVRSYSVGKDKIKKEKYIVIYNAISEAHFKCDGAVYISKRKELGIKNDEFLIGNVGTFSIRKGQIYLLKAFHKLKQTFPSTKLIIVGGSRSHEFDIEKEIKDYIKKNNLSNSVILLETVKDINSLYNAMDLFVMPSISEGFSLAALECMLTQRLCLFSDIGPFKELVRDSYNGYLFKNKDSGSLFERLKYIKENYYSLSHIGVNARSSVLERFSYTKMIESYNELYSSNYTLL